MAGLLTLGLVGTSSWGVEPTTSSSPFPAKAPRGLGEEDFEQLSGAWAQWSAEAADRVAKFYTAPDAASRKAALDDVKIKLGTLETALKDPKYGSIRAPLSRLYGRLSRRVRIAEAVVATSELDLSKHRETRLAATRGDLSNALAAVRSRLKAVPGGEAWLPFVHADQLQGVVDKKDESKDALNILAQVEANLANRDSLPADQKAFLEQPSLRQLGGAIDALISAIELPTGDAATASLNRALAAFVNAIEEYEERFSEASTEGVRNTYLVVTQQSPDGGQRITDAMREAYLNYNLRVHAGEGILQRLFSDSRSESSWINDRTSEAYISGYQCTNTQATVDVIASGRDARFNLIVTGNVVANATATTHPATIATVGNHTFRAEKQIWTDGKHFDSAPATVAVSANTQVTGASTKADWIPIVRRVARNIALNEASSRMGEANSMAASKIREQLVPRLNQEVASKFSGASMELETRVYGPLRELGLYPDALALSSTDTLIDLRARVMNADEVGANVPAPGVASNRDELLAQVHESLLNNGIDRVGFHGQTLTETQIGDLLQARFKKLLGDKFQAPAKKEPAAGEPARKEVTFVFDQQDPVRFKVEDGQLRLQLQTGMKRTGEGGVEEDIPPQQITIPLKFTVVGDEIKMERGTVSVKPIPGREVENRARQIVSAGVMRQNIEKLFESKTFKGSFDVGSEKKIKLNARSIDADAGWISVRLK